MSEVVVHQIKKVVDIFGREAKGVGERKVAGRENNFTEWGVFVVGRDGAVGGLIKFGVVFVAVNGIQLMLGVGLVERKRTCRDRLGWIPDEMIGR